MRERHTVGGGIGRTSDLGANRTRRDGGNDVNDPFRSSPQTKSRTATRAQRAPEWHLAVRPSAQDARHQPRGARAGIPRDYGYTLRLVDNVEKSLSGLDRAQWRHTIRIVHRHCRVFQRGRRGATLRKGRSTMEPSTTVYLR